MLSVMAMITAPPNSRFQALIWLPQMVKCPACRSGIARSASLANVFVAVNSKIRIAPRKVAPQGLCFRQIRCHLFAPKLGRGCLCRDRGIISTLIGIFKPLTRREMDQMPLIDPVALTFGWLG